MLKLFVNLSMLTQSIRKLLIVPQKIKKQQPSNIPTIRQKQREQVLPLTCVGSPGFTIVNEYPLTMMILTTWVPLSRGDELFILSNIYIGVLW